MTRLARGRLRLLENALGMQIKDASSAQRAASLMLDALRDSGDELGLAPADATMGAENRALLHDQIRALIGLAPLGVAP